jgi:hypothetical protein
MKNIFLLTLILISSTAFAKDANVTVCDSANTKTQFVVKGKKIQLLVNGVSSRNFVLVRETDEVPDDLKDAPKWVGEPLTSGHGYVLEEDGFYMGIFLFTGASGANYLFDGTVNLGSSKNCK